MPNNRTIDQRASSKQELSQPSSRAGVRQSSCCLISEHCFIYLCGKSRRPTGRSSRHRGGWAAEDCGVHTSTEKWLLRDNDSLAATRRSQTPKLFLWPLGNRTSLVGDRNKLLSCAEPNTMTRKASREACIVTSKVQLESQRVTILGKVAFAAGFLCLG